MSKSFLKKSRGKLDNRFNKRKRRCSLEGLSHVDDMVQDLSRLNNSSSALPSTIYNKNICQIQLEKSNLSLHLVDQVPNNVLYFKEEGSKLQMSSKCDQQTKSAQEDLFECEDIDSALLLYSTPLKCFSKKENAPEHKRNETSKSLQNCFYDSWFEELDFSNLEKISVEEPCKNNVEVVNNCKTDLSRKDCPPLNVPEVNHITPSQNKFIPKSSTSTIKSRLRKRLVENAHKTPQLANNEGFKNMLEAKLKAHSENAVNIENMSTQDIGPFFGLPSRVKSLLEKLRGIESLYEWQKDCLARNELKTGKNLIYTLPTSGGKTLVAEILIMKTLLCQKKNALLVLPFVAIVQEKIQSLSQFAIELGFLIEEYAGGKGRFPPRKRRKKNVLYVCTIEKANSLVNSLIETNRLDELKLVVIDELHMIGEGGKRGAIIEMLLAKILHLSVPIQIIGMSATLSNSNQLAGFLNANVFYNDFRPVKLDEFVKITDCVYRINCNKLHPDDKLTKERTLSKKTNNNTVDDDHLASLVLEVIPQHSCLMFCPTKKNCENVSLMICKLLPMELKQYRQEEKQKILKALRNDSGDICPTLRRIIPYGVAYHHSGLTSDERRIIEDAYRSNILSTITCTSTLAAGVNLPARRVIIRSPHIGQEFLSRAQYKQMIGRAGRAGIDTKGESYLIVSKPQDQSRIFELISGPVETCISSLLYDNGRGFQTLLLSVIFLKIVTNESNACTFFTRTLCSRQIEILKARHPIIFESILSEDNVETKCANDTVVSQQLVRRYIQQLVNLKLVEEIVQKDGIELKTTNLGKATSKCGIDYDIINKLYDDLKLGLQSLVLENYLHLLFLITPYDASNGISPNWLLYMSEFNRMSGSELNTASLIGVPEQYVVCRASGRNPRKKKFDDKVVNRFYVTLMLYELFKGKSVWDVSVHFEQPRGFLQSFLTNSASFASSVLRFTQEFEEFWPYQALFEKLIEALQYCRVTELVPLMEINSVKLARAKQLFKAGFRTLAQIAAADATSLMKSIELLSKRQAQQIIASAKVLLAEKVETLQDEMEQLKSCTESV